MLQRMTLSATTHTVNGGVVAISRFGRKHHLALASLTLFLLPVADSTTHVHNHVDDNIDVCDDFDGAGGNWIDDIDHGGGSEYGGRRIVRHLPQNHGVGKKVSQSKRSRLRSLLA